MSISTLVRTVIIKHERFGPFKFEIYESEGRYFAEILSRNDDGRWMVNEFEYGFVKAISVDDAQKSCEIYIKNLGK